MFSRRSGGKGAVGIADVDVRGEEFTPCAPRGVKLALESRLFASNPAMAPKCCYNIPFFGGFFRGVTGPSAPLPPLGNTRRALPMDDEDATLTMRLALRRMIEYSLRLLRRPSAATVCESDLKTSERSEGGERKNHKPRTEW